MGVLLTFVGESKPSSGGKPHLPDHELELSRGLILDLKGFQGATELVRESQG